MTAAREAEAEGARVTVVEARDRVGGRVYTVRELFAGGQHAEGGADLIESQQTEVRELAGKLGLRTVQILRGGFGYYGPDRGGRRRMRNAASTFAEIAERLRREIEDYRLAGKRWDSAVAHGLASKSVAQWLKETHAGEPLASSLRALRGFFLADPDELSLISLVDQFAAAGPPGGGPMYRIDGGNDRLPRAMAASLRGRLLLGTVVRRIRQHGGRVQVTIEQPRGTAVLEADYVVSALPATTLRDVRFEPGLPPEQRRAIESLRYGCATRMLLQFARPFWRKVARPRAFGTDLPIGAVWDASEHQKSPPAILSLLAGGSASRELWKIIARKGAGGVVAQLAWLGAPSKLLAAQTISWEDDGWARGGYAYFDPSYDPSLRPCLARPFGRVLFAGEHTSREWQGYMSGAIESGRRAAAEIRWLDATR